MSKKFFITLLILLVVGLVLGGLISRWQRGAQPVPVNDDNQKKNGVVANEMIEVSNIVPGQVVSSPLVVEGRARGPWYFEASFPVRLFDANGREIAVGIAQAQGEWMTTEFVPFQAELVFSPPDTEAGLLVLEKSNPSGLPEHEDQVAVPVRFSSFQSSAVKPCVVTGCSGQLCAEEEIGSTCEYLPEYACYKTAQCQRQTGGQCGWTLDEALRSCLAQY